MFNSITNRDTATITQNTVFIVRNQGRNSDDSTWFDDRKNRCCFKSTIEFQQFNCRKEGNNQWTCPEENGATPFRCHIPVQNGHFTN